MQIPISMTAPRPEASQYRRAGLTPIAKLLLGLGSLVLPLAPAAAWEFTPRVALGQVWTDNVELAPDGFEESEWITELRPGFAIKAEAPRARVNLDYDLQMLWFADNSDFNDTFHQANGTGNFTLAPDSLFLDTYARFDQQNIDTSERIDFSNLFVTDNRTDAFVFGASPYHIWRWGSWGESLVRYQYQGVRYSDTDDADFEVEDSDSNAISAALGSPLGARGLSWRATGSYTLTEFDVADEFEYARVEVDMGLPVSPRTRVTATFGQESDIEEDPTKGGLDSSFWYVGFNWQASELQSLEGRVGERFFGTAWEFHWRRRGARGETSVDYTEEPTNSSGVLGDDGIFQPGVPPTGVGSLDSRVFLQKRLSASSSYRWARSSVLARLYHDRREYQDATGGTETNYGAILSYDWDVATRTRLGATGRWSRSDFESDSKDDNGEFGLRLTRELTRTLSAVLSASHLLRNSKSSDDYSANQASLYFEARF